VTVVAVRAPRPSATSTRPSALPRLLCPFTLALLASHCRCDAPDGGAPAEPSTSASVARPVPSEGPPPQLLYLPDGGDVAPGTAPDNPRVQLGGSHASSCPPEMVDVRGQFCIDRYEAILVDAKTGERLSPYYAPERVHVRTEFRRYSIGRPTAETVAARTHPVPEPPRFELEREFSPRAEVRAGEIPNGYVSGDLAKVACQNAGKRLCREVEWVTACRGEQDRDHPYGDGYVQNQCNVFREAHPAALLHGNASINHLDPRLNMLRGPSGKPLLQPTGAYPTCASQWGDDRVYDLVGNLAEWVDDEHGAFLGGFYSRSTREGCARKVTAHPNHYFDYSLGVRCCLSK